MKQNLKYDQVFHPSQYFQQKINACQHQSKATRLGRDAKQAFIVFDKIYLPYHRQLVYKNLIRRPGTKVFEPPSRQLPALSV